MPEPKDPGRGPESTTLAAESGLRYGYGLGNYGFVHNGFLFHGHGGDGDGFSIGGNHFMHACRRNVDITYIAMDNEVYGMTKGQASPTTAADWTDSKLTPHGTGITPFEPTSLALAAGASFVARGFSGR